jgi:hypothetical protein
MILNLIKNKNNVCGTWGDQDLKLICGMVWWCGVVLLRVVAVVG